MKEGAIFVRARMAAGAALLADLFMLRLVRAAFPISEGHLIAWAAAATVAAVLSWKQVRRGALPLIYLLPPLVRAGVIRFYADSYPSLQFTPMLAASATSAVVCYFLLVVFDTGRAQRFQEQLWVGVIAVILAVKLINLPIPNLLAEEAYYWKYAENLAPGYLDHPPFVAVLIFLGNFIFGVTEFATRAGAFLCWGGSALFLASFSALLFGRQSALPAVALFAVLPYFFGAGFFITPDSPLMLCWAGALYFTARAVLMDDRWFWYPAGLCFGLGMLAKYPMALLGAAVLVFILIDSRARRHLLSIHPYIAALLALAVFSPVLYWNSRNHWASFVFQGPARLEASGGFSLHIFLLHLLIVLTPAGAAAFAQLLKRGWSARRETAENERRIRYCLVMAAVPVAVFLISSFAHEPKVNWTGPAFLAVLPILSGAAGSAGERSAIRRAWNFTLALLVIAYGVLFHFFSLGVPGITPRVWVRKFAGWDDLAAKVTSIAQEFELQSGQSPLVVGLDKHYVASEIGFYRAKQAYLNGLAQPEPTQGRRLFDRFSLMYDFWSKPGDARGRAMVLVSRTKADLGDEAVQRFVSLLGPVQEIPVEFQSKPIGSYYYRLASGYRPQE